MSAYGNHRDRNTGRILFTIGVILLVAAISGLILGAST
jgi:hypothetical protein